MIYRLMRPGEAGRVCEMIARSAARYLAPDYTPEGLREFLLFASPAEMAARNRTSCWTLLAVEAGEVAGALEMCRQDGHITLLFVAPEFVRRGIGRALVARAAAISRFRRANLEAITVNASPYGLPFYEAAGFVATGGEQEKMGIRFTPMVLRLAD